MPKIPIVNPASNSTQDDMCAAWDLPRIFLQLWSSYICSTYKKLDPLSVSDANFYESLTHTSPIHVADGIRITIFQWIGILKFSIIKGIILEIMYIRNFNAF